MHCVQYIWNIDIMQARARLLERKMEEDQVRRTLRYLAKVETVEYRAKVPTRVTLSSSVASRHSSAAMRTRTTCASSVTRGSKQASNASITTRS